jgi:hypothetical protein
MNPRIQAALKKKNAGDFLNALRAAFDYSVPDDLERIGRDGKLAVLCNCFAFEMFSGGYLQVVDNLPDWADDILQSLRRINAAPYAEGFARVLRIAKANRLAPYSDTEWWDYLEAHPEFEKETVRDYAAVVDVVGERLREYIQKHEATFGGDAAARSAASPNRRPARRSAIRKSGKGRRSVS